MIPYNTRGKFSDLSATITHKANYSIKILILVKTIKFAVKKVTAHQTIQLLPNIIPLLLVDRFLSVMVYECSVVI